MHDPTGILTSLADAELATLGVRLRRVADTLLAALNPALRVQVACDLADLRGDIDSFLNRFANKLDDRSRTSLILAQQELAATIAALDGGVIAGHA